MSEVTQVGKMLKPGVKAEILPVEYEDRKHFVCVIRTVVYVK